MDSYIKTRKINSIGPLITVSHGASLTENQELGMDIMVQVKERTMVGERYEFLDTVRIPNWVYVRFKGNIQELNYGYSKLELYIWENKLTKNGATYTVFASMEDINNIGVDIFIPVEGA